MELDLRGYRYDEAMVAGDQYLETVLSNYEQVYIIHIKEQVRCKRCKNI